MFVFGVSAQITGSWNEFKDSPGLRNRTLRILLLCYLRFQVKLLILLSSSVRRRWMPCLLYHRK